MTYAGTKTRATCPKCRGRMVYDRGAGRGDDSLLCLSCHGRRWRWQRHQGAGIADPVRQTEARRERLRESVEFELRRQIREAEGI